jgi:hypothetical protein
LPLFAHSAGVRKKRQVIRPKIHEAKLIQSSQAGDEERKSSRLRAPMPPDITRDRCEQPSEIIRVRAR